MNKSKQWRHQRHLRRREKARERKAASAHRRVGRTRTGGATIDPGVVEKQRERLWAFLSRVVPKQPKHQDKR